MNRDPSVRLLFVVILAAVFWSALKVIGPFIAGFTWAAVLVVTFRPFHEWLAKKFGGRRWIASAIVTILAAAFVVVPLVMAATQATQGAVAAYQWIMTNYQASGTDLGLTDRWPWLNDLVTRAKDLVGLANVDLNALGVNALKKVAQFAAVQGPALMGSAFNMAWSFLVMLGGMPLFFVHGQRFSRAIFEALPVPENDALRILAELRDMTRTVFISVGVTAAVQAALMGLALLVLGVPSVIPLAAATFFAALIPGGPGLIWIPCAIWLASDGHTVKAILMVAWGAGVVGTIDNVLRPLLAGKGVKLPGVILFLGMFGGMISFGLVGLFLGPIALYMTRELVAILRRDIYAPAGQDVTASKL
ncbi:MAG TPA: AI-2E family transporter [Candidatus Polarisedimenticolaceae bacterium]|nr:AI-2E family transporter [Candidatus Polarisedimenticolaceae bacterium]